jgi:hypothetical protein
MKYLLVSKGQYEYREEHIFLVDDLCDIEQVSLDYFKKNISTKGSPADFNYIGEEHFFDFVIGKLNEYGYKEIIADIHLDMNELIYEHEAKLGS